jgi:hypothetical protein
MSKHHALKTYKAHEGEVPPILNPFVECYFLTIFQNYAILTQKLKDGNINAFS